MVRHRARRRGCRLAEFKSYALRHKTAAEVGRTLSELLGRDAEMIVDARANRILVRGPEKAQQVARQLIAAVDQDARSQPNAQASNTAKQRTIRAGSLDGKRIGAGAGQALRRAIVSRRPVELGSMNSSSRTKLARPSPYGTTRAAAVS